MSDELLAASATGDGDTVTTLLQEGVSVNSQDENGDNGLHLSCEKGHEEVVKIFLDNECDINGRGYKLSFTLVPSSSSFFVHANPSFHPLVASYPF